MNRFPKSRLSVPLLLVLGFSLSVPAQEFGSDAKASALDPFLDELFALGLAPGASVGVVQGNDVVYLRGFGHADAERKRPVTPDTVFYIASSTKSFTAMVASILHERGELDLDAGIDGYLQGARFHEDVDPGQITLRDLLTHTHGLAGSGPVSFRVAYTGQHTPELLHELLQHHGPASTGRTFVYSNIGYNVASLVMDDVLETSWKDVLQVEIFDPLGMASTTAYASRVPDGTRAMPFGEEVEGFVPLYDTKGDENMHAAGGIMTTASDLVRWLIANLNEGRLDDRQALPASAVSAAHVPHAEQNADFDGFGRTGYALGWNTGAYDGDQQLHHFGGFAGYHAHVSFMPEHGIGVVVLANTSRLGSMMATVGSRYIYDTLLGKPDTEERFRKELETTRMRVDQARFAIRTDRARRSRRSQELSHPLEAYAGTYSNPIVGEVTFTVVDGALEMTMGRMWSTVEVFDAVADALRVEPAGGGEVMSFDFSGDADRARSLRYDQLTFRRVERQD